MNIIKNEVSIPTAAQQVASLKQEASIQETAQKVEVLNQEGMQLVDRGDYKGAFSVFAVGIRLAKQALCVTENHENISHITTTTTKTDSTIIKPACSFSQIVQDSSTSSEQNFFVEDPTGNHPLVFKRPLPICCSITGPGQDATPSDYLKRRVAFVQCFNLAITVHLSALSYDGKKSKEAVNKKLQKALSLYECALEMETDALQLSIFEKMALVNNMAHIHSFLDNTKYSQDCFKHVMYLLDLANEETSNNHDYSTEISSSQQQLHEVFMANAIAFFLFPYASRPAAAA
jgi:hypothetical protein